MKTIALISCAKGKKSHAAPAAELYQSQLFDGMKRYAQANADQYFILSAKHGLVDPTTVLEPYDMTLHTFTKGERRDWSERVVAKLALELAPGDRVIILGGVLYREHMQDWLEEAGYQCLVPMRGLEIGQQLQYLKHAVQYA